MRLLLVLLLTGCAQLKAIDYSIAPPEDWPLKEIVVTQFDPGTTPPLCAQYAGHTRSCAVINFRTGVCYISLTTNEPEVVEHERAHCRGFDHVGDLNRSRSKWEEWKKANGK